MAAKEPTISDIVIIVDTNKEVRPYSVTAGDRTFMTTDLAIAHATDQALETGDPHIITPHRGGTRWKVQRARQKKD
jgi:hypothetical protein